ncbi:MAG: 30S ribosomal protein S6 [Spirochaetia bacterium]|nr:30S ribosomal protein S6 [Spirochaetota bacterium]MCX8097179.1 30S ribosomal protein S6 [Spirochaetota bacterium]MDW8112648.1 30S ribosomal protein S6 [Spirochaetia bacterium]
MDVKEIRSLISQSKQNQLKTYEIGLILEPIEQIVGTVMDKVKGIITQYGGKVLNESELGRRTLAYPIRKNRKKYLEGIYKFIVFEGTYSTVENLDRLVRINENIIRHIILKIKHTN